MTVVALALELQSILMLKEFLYSGTIVDYEGATSMLCAQYRRPNSTTLLQSDQGEGLDPTFGTQAFDET